MPTLIILALFCAILYSAFRAERKPINNGVDKYWQKSYDKNGNVIWKEKK